MDWFARFAHAGVLLAINLAVVPLVLPLDLAGGGTQEATAASHNGPEPLELRPAVLSLPSPPSAHIIMPGDTLWDISQMAGVSVAALAAANQICEDDPVVPGRVLVVPTSDISGPNPVCVQQTLELMRISWPLSGRVTSRFGWRTHPIFGTREFHTGVDIATPAGAPVVAARSGIVRFVGWMTGYGRVIILDHGHGLQTIYAHLSAAIVSVGARVTMGDLIGRVGSTGWSTGPHLLFEIRRNGVPLDPLGYMH